MIAVGVGTGETVGTGEVVWTGQAVGTGEAKAKLEAKAEREAVGTVAEPEVPMGTCRTDHLRNCSQKT